MGVTLDYESLCEPYSEPSEGATRAPKRTAAGQKLWLSQRGFPEPVVAAAMEMVYTELAAGRIFTKKDGDTRPAGYWLDRCLLDTCRNLMLESHAGGLDAAKDQFATVAAFTRGSVRNAAIKSYLAGVATGGGIAWLLMRLLG